MAKNISIPQLINAKGELDNVSLYKVIKLIAEVVNDLNKNVLASEEIADIPIVAGETKRIPHNLGRKYNHYVVSGNSGGITIRDNRTDNPRQHSEIWLTANTGQAEITTTISILIW